MLQPHLGCGGSAPLSPPFLLPMERYWALRIPFLECCKTVPDSHGANWQGDGLKPWVSWWGQPSESSCKQQRDYFTGESAEWGLISRLTNSCHIFWDPWNISPHLKDIILKLGSAVLQKNRVNNSKSFCISTLEIRKMIQYFIKPF